jgi:RNA polymerase sigma-70 factor (ECF subfamily)
MNRNEKVLENDLDLVDRFKAGEEAAFNALVDRYMKKIFNVAYRITKNQADAEEITQETFVKAFRRIETFRQQSSFYTWIYRIAINLSLNLIRKKGRQTYEFNELQEESRVNPVQLDTLIREQRDKRLESAIALLPEKQRKTLILRIYEGLSTRETANIMSCSEGTVKANLFFAIKTLRKELTGV